MNLTMKCLAVVAIGLTSTVRSQTISAYRYWVDEDLASITTTTVAGGTVFTLNTPLPVSALSPGLHKVSLQFRDSNNAWSVPVERYFSKSGANITAYRYWIDEDLASSITNTVTAGSSYTLTQLPLGSVSPGLHKVSLQFRDAQTNWSVPVERYFSKSGAALTAWQYWFDDNVGALTETAIGPSTTINVAQDLDAGTLGYGTHNLTWRSKDAMGNWSVPVSQDFDVITGVDEVPGLERVLLFPNPAGHQVQLRFDAPEGAELRIEVLDATGRILRNEERVSIVGTTLRTIATGTWPAGNYHLRLIGTQGVKDLPFIKL